MSFRIVLGAPSTESLNRTFQCKQGHTIISNAPPTISWYSEANVGTPVCPFCLIEFCRQAFPMQETVAATRVLATSTTNIPAFNPCKQEGCILAFHGGNQHMNAKREMFTAELTTKESTNDSQRAGDGTQASKPVEQNGPQKP